MHEKRLCGKGVLGDEERAWEEVVCGRGESV